MRRFSLASKITLILSLVVVMYAALDHVIQRLVVLKSFQALERFSATKDLQRVVKAIGNEASHLGVRCSGWADWDQTRQFIDDTALARDSLSSGTEHDAAEVRIGAYVSSNLGPATFHNDDINLLYVCDGNGRVLWGRILDLQTNRDLQLPREFPRQQLAPGHPLLAPYLAPQAGIRPKDSGIISTEQGPMLVCSKPVLDVRADRPMRGIVIMGRLLTQLQLSSLIKQTGVNFHAWRVDDEELDPSEKRIVDEVTASATPIVEDADDSTVYAYTTMPNLLEAPALLLRADVSRDITKQGASSVRYALLSTIAAGLLIMLVLLILLNRAVLEPVVKLTKHVVAIGKSDDTTTRLCSDRADEIGILSREFDSMMDKLAHSRSLVVSAARAAGMSEIAAGTLHNVGNALNSVNVSAMLVVEKASHSGIADLRSALEVVRESSNDLCEFLAKDPRGKHFYPLLISLAEQIETRQETVVAELKALTGGIDHIKEVIAAQQEYAGRAGVLEVTSLEDEIERAVTVTRRNLESDEIEIVREYDDVPPCKVDRHRLLEILLNVLHNARQAMEHDGRSGDGGAAPSSGAPARLTLRLKSEPRGRVRIEIQDTGMGIAPENLSRVFTHGFTTKKSGHGFGLHASANAATEMGGTLTARSDGPGTGATFILTLPVAETTSAAA
jgi:signal transduction histidine kinase